MERLRRDSVLSHVAIGLLVAAIAAVPVMLVLTVNTSAASVTVGRFSTASCPSKDDVRCYGAVVTNTGDGQTGVDCRLVPQGGPPATFFNGTTKYVSGGSLLPSSSITLMIKLAPSVDASPALPTLACEPA